MKPGRSSRTLAIFLAFASMLFTQLAVAAYACPGLAAMSSASMQAEPLRKMAMAGCQQMDPVEPTLCHAFAQDGTSKQSADTPSQPGVQAFMSGALFTVVDVAAIVPDMQTDAAPAAMLARTTAPPIAIRHCCFRI